MYISEFSISTMIRNIKHFLTTGQYKVTKREQNSQMISSDVGGGQPNEHDRLLSTHGHNSQNTNQNSNSIFAFKFFGSSNSTTSRFRTGSFDHNHSHHGHDHVHGPNCNH